MHLPDGVGLEILQKLKSHDILKDCPFLVMSTESQQQIIINSFEAGATNYILKPFSMDDLLEKLNYCWEKTSKKKEGVFFKKTPSDGLKKTNFSFSWLRKCGFLPQGR
jgi:DNA-binding response OmpR family regulator